MLVDADTPRSGLLLVMQGVLLVQTPEGEDDTPTSEEDVLELMKSTFDARELDE